MFARASKQVLDKLLAAMSVSAIAVMLAATEVQA